MAYVSQTALKYLADKQASKGDLQEQWTKLEELYNKKLWHQSTLLILKLIKHPSFLENGEILKLYHDFVSDFESRMNPISLVEICGAASDQIPDSAEAIAFLQKVEGKVKASAEAVVLCRVFQGGVRLHKSTDIAAAKNLIEDLEPMVDDLSSVTFIHGRFFRLASDYYKLAGAHAQYFRTALRFLGCTDLAELAVAEKQQHAFFLGLAALLGIGIYNFGELLAHPILESLSGTQHSWVTELLVAFNSGDLSTFERLRPQWTGQPDLRVKEPQLLQKIQLLALMEMTFRRAATERCLTFVEIAAETRLPEEQVELHVMKALAQKLVRGHIDQVDRTVNLTWVQPRVLNKPQLSTMIQRLDSWCQDVQNMEILLEQKAHDILTL